MTLQTDPICGGIYPIFGLFVGGSDINHDYDIKKKSPYELATQLRTPKQSILSKISLMDARSDPSKMKLYGKLDTPADFVT